MMKAPHLLALGYPAAGDDDDLVLFVERHHLGHAVGGAGVVDVAAWRKKKEKSGMRKNTNEYSREGGSAQSETPTEPGRPSGWRRSPARC